jgi:hypothetical protein
VRKLLLICLAALALRVGLLGIVSFPGTNFEFYGMVDPAR